MRLTNTAQLISYCSMPRFTVDFDEQFNKTLEKLRESSEATTKAEVLRRAVASYATLRSEVAKGNNVSITNPNGEVLKDIILP